MCVSITFYWYYISFLFRVKGALQQFTWRQEGRLVEYLPMSPGVFSMEMWNSPPTPPPPDPGNGCWNYYENSRFKWSNTLWYKRGHNINVKYAV